jgi:hypothetical protein
MGPWLRSAKRAYALFIPALNDGAFRAIEVKGTLLEEPPPDVYFLNKA